MVYSPYFFDCDDSENVSNYYRRFNYEIIHSLIVITWNVHTAFKRFDIHLATIKQ